jgi:hypothetical protein
VKSIAGGVLAAAVVLPMTSALAQQPVSDLPGLTIETKVTPKRSLFLFWTYGYDLSIDFYIDNPMPEFPSFFVRCELDHSDDKNGHLSMWLKIVRSEFKLISDSRSVAERAAIFIPGNTLTDVKCRVQSPPQ